MTTLLQPQRLLDQMRSVRPRNKRELAAYVTAFTGWRIPSQTVCPGHQAPLDYLAWSFWVITEIWWGCPPYEQHDARWHCLGEPGRG